MQNVKKYMQSMWHPYLVTKMLASTLHPLKTTSKQRQKCGSAAEDKKKWQKNMQAQLDRGTMQAEEVHFQELTRNAPKGAQSAQNPAIWGKQLERLWRRPREYQPYAPQRANALRFQ